MGITQIILGVAVVLFGWIAVTFNSLVLGRNRVKEAWSDIDVQLKRRYDLIPNLIQTVKGYMKHEKDTLTKVVEMRTLAMQGGSIKERAQHENILSGALKSIFALSESYPNLKANETFMELQHELSDTENKIQAARRFYNGTVRDFNTKIEQFPTNIVSNIFKFKARDFFELTNKKERETVKVDFDTEK
jgi:LemA protein